MIAAIAVAGPCSRRSSTPSGSESGGQTVIRPLLGGRIVLTPEDRSYRFEAPVSWGGLVAALVDGFGATTTYPPGGP